jgi:uracil-DNA glycosylase family 4
MKRKDDLVGEMARIGRDLRQALGLYGQRGEETIPGQLPALVAPPAAVVAPEPGRGEVLLPPVDLGKEARLENLRQQALACKRCRLAKGRQKVVFGVGTSSSKLVLVGEGPGANEDRTGEPFVGRAGQLLNQMLKVIGFAREEVYITNIVKCRPPRNRDPEPDEIAACRPFLDAQLETIRPDVLLALGRPAAQSLLNEQRALGQLRNKVHKLAGMAVLVTYHPAFLLRNPVRKGAVWEDLQLLVDLLVRKGVQKALPEPWWRR